MRADRVVEADPFLDNPAGCEAVRELVQVDRFLLQGSPQPLDEDVVEVSPASVHGYLHLGRL